jgi:hypothetical protein
MPLLVNSEKFAKIAINFRVVGDRLARLSQRVGLIFFEAILSMQSDALLEQGGNVHSDFNRPRH